MLLHRDLAIALRARVTWTVAVLGALLVGHSFVLAIDLFAAGSRSVQSSGLMAREFDPLAGIIRPTLGGLYLAVSLLAPILAARALAVEKERHSLGALLLASRSSTRVVLRKFVTAALSSALPLGAVLAALVAWRVLGGHLAWGETAVALSGHVLYLAWIAALGTAAAAWTRTAAQATTVAIVAVLASWAIDAAEGFAALAWLGRATDWSVTTHLTPFERGALMPGAVAWFAVLIVGLLGLAVLGVRVDLSVRARTLGALAGTAILLLAMIAANRWRGGWDATESARASLPPGAIAGLRAIPDRITLEIYLDRDDSRRRQMETDVLAKLRLARPDLRVLTPLDGRETPSEATRDEGYGRTVVHVSSRRGETFSASRREITTLIFETAGRPLPNWSQAAYPGYPLVPSPVARRRVGWFAYGWLPAAMLGFGLWITRTRRRTA